MKKIALVFSSKHKEFRHISAPHSIYLLKALTLFLPITVIAGGAVWISFLQNSLTKLNALAAPIEERINLISPAVTPPAEKEPELFLQEDGSLNWTIFENLAARHTLRFSGAESLIDGLVIDQQIIGLGPDHLKQTLTELETLALPKGLKLQIEHTAAWLLAQENPLEILNSKKKHQWEKTTGLSIKAFGLYTRTEPIDAAAWLDTQINAGLLKSRNLLKPSDTRLRLEFLLLPHLAKKNYPMARIRVFDLSEAERVQLFSRPMYFHKDHPELLLLARGSLPKQDANRIIADAYTSFYPGLDHLTQADEVLKSLPFSDDEKDAILRKAVGGIITPEGRLEELVTAYNFVKEFAESEASRLVARELARLAPEDLKKFYVLTQTLAIEVKDQSLIPLFIRQLPLSSVDLFNRLIGLQDQSIAEKIRTDYDKFLPENEDE